MSRAHAFRKNVALILTGAAMGATAALLLAPTSGEHTRSRIGRGYKRTIKHIGTYSNRLQDRAEDLMLRAIEVRQHAENIRNRVANVIHSRRAA